MRRASLLCLTAALFSCASPQVAERAPAPDQQEQTATWDDATQTRFDRCRQAHDTSCLLALYRTHPNTPRSADILHALALGFEQERALGKAIKVRFFLLKDHPDSRFVAHSLHQLGSHYQALAQYKNAAKFYELFADHAPEHASAINALHNAALFHEGLGDLPRAIELHERVYRQYRETRPDHARHSLLEIARIHVRLGQTPSACAAYEDYVSEFGSRRAEEFELVQESMRTLGCQ